VIALSAPAPGGRSKRNRLTVSLLQKTVVSLLRLQVAVIDTGPLPKKSFNNILIERPGLPSVLCPYEGSTCQAKPATSPVGNWADAVRTEQLLHPIVSVAKHKFLNLSIDLISAEAGPFNYE
jgi:hypothetical protein